MTDFTVSNAVVSIALLSKYVSKQTIHGTKVKKNRTFRLALPTAETFAKAVNILIVFSTD